MATLTREGTPVRPAGDAKAGWCQSCREGHCSLCAADNCACPDKRKHTRRPSYGRVSTARPPAAGDGTPRPATAKDASAKLTAPHIELVRSDTPQRPAKNLAEQLRPLLEQLMAEEDHESYRIVVFPGARRAGMNRGRLAKAYPEFTWESHRLDEVDQSAIWVRWLGPARVLS